MFVLDLQKKQNAEKRRISSTEEEKKRGSFKQRRLNDTEEEQEEEVQTDTQVNTPVAPFRFLLARESVPFPCSFIIIIL